ncbi:PQQ-dependent sugar dehydrogenase [Ferruginivarius sediminum]|uniref:PQQ-dependent sugar dehydrogenase n=1 Tax=Ferruginivarius sediminum TaxID=2661937 RepID=UPI00137A5131|nr:PQQ-dependent sugar dehydrogenase [Ferruginivarius sediminum]
MKPLTLAATVLALLAFSQVPAACAQTPEDSPVTLDRVFPELKFERPVALIQSPTADATWYVVEQRGVVWRVEASRGKTDKTVFADIRGRVEDGPNEAGLLGMAFHPNFARNGEVFLSYTTDAPGLTSRIARYRSPDAGTTLDVGGEEVLLELEQPFGNHNGGHIAFGPDGYLYAGFGDGGAGGDPHGNGQDPMTLLGTILRLDIDDGNGESYGIPPDNPFAGKSGGRPEIHAWGLRNPWRFAFDPETGALWAADVGQNQWEEVDVIRRAGNYGWNIREGAHCYRAGDCATDGLIDPVAEYSHRDGCSITGGHVYRGKTVPALDGHYVYGDYCSGRIWAMPAGTPDRPGAPRLILDTDLAISSFAQDREGEVYVIDHDDGAIYRLAMREPS